MKANHEIGKDTIISLIEFLKQNSDNYNKDDLLKTLDIIQDFLVIEEENTKKELRKNG